MLFADLMYQDAAVRQIQRALRVGRVPHAIVLSGPEGVGKEMLAERLAAVLLCAEPRETPPPEEGAGSPNAWLNACGRCTDCELFSAGSHPDFHRIYRTLNKLHPDKAIRKRKAIDLGVDVIRHFLIDPIGLRPARGRAKAYVVVEADRLNDSAQNALLKTLEEPPGHSYLILLSSSGDALLPTTRSRCRQIQLRPLPADFVARRLVEKCGVQPAAARFLAELTNGSLGLAIQRSEEDLLKRVPAVFRAVEHAAKDPFAGGRDLIELCDEIAKEFKGDSEALAADKTALGRRAQCLVLSVVSTVFRDALRLMVGRPPAACENEPAVAALARQSSISRIGSSIRQLAAAERQINQNGNKGLIFDSVGIAINHAFRPGV